MGDAPNHGKATEDEAPRLEEDSQSNSESDRGRLRRKRSFEDFEGDHSEEKPADKLERHTRKKSRDISSPHSGPDSRIRKSSGESSVPRIDERGDEPMKSTESNGVDDSILSQEMDTKSPTTPTGSDSTSKEEGMVISPKNKRSRDEYLQGQDKEISSLAGEANKMPRAERANSNTAPPGASKEERSPKRHRDSNSPRLSGGEEEKPGQTKVSFQRRAVLLFCRLSVSLDSPRKWLLKLLSTISLRCPIWQQVTECPATDIFVGL